MDSLIKKACAIAGVDEATLRKMARQFDSPELREAFDKNFSNDDLDQTITELQQQLDEVLNHVKSPNVGGNRGRS